VHLDSPFFVIKAKCLVFVDVRQLVCLVIVNYLTFLLGIQGSYVANSLVFEGFGQDFLSIVVFINSFEHCRFATLGLSLSQSELSFIFKRGFPFVLVLEAIPSEVAGFATSVAQALFSLFLLFSLTLTSFFSFIYFH